MVNTRQENSTGEPRYPAPNSQGRLTSRIMYLLFSANAAALEVRGGGGKEKTAVRECSGRQAAQLCELRWTGSESKHALPPRKDPRGPGPEQL